MRSAVAVVGDGPAGYAAAAALAGAGVEVLHVRAAGQRRWRNTYGVWQDELAGLDLDGALARCWAAPEVAFAGGRRQPLPRAYALVANDRLQEILEQRALRAGARPLVGRVTETRPDAAGIRLRLDSGARAAVGMVVDATGFPPALTRGGGREPAWQVAYGLVGHFEPPPLPAGTMTLMDWSRPPGGAGPPTFLYALELTPGRWLLEETSLAARPAVPLPVLARRLRQRLASRQVRLPADVSEERVRIPMGGELPAVNHRIVPFGVAAGMVHPATGYQLAAALRAAPALATGVRAALDAAVAEPADLAAAAHAAVWTPDRRRQRALHVYGLEVLLRLDADQLSAFFRAFFALPEPSWRGYLSGTVDASALAEVLLAVARALPPALRLALLRPAASGAAVDLLRALLAARR